MVRRAGDVLGGGSPGVLSVVGSSVLGLVGPQRVADSWVWQLAIRAGGVHPTPCCRAADAVAWPAGNAA